MTSVVVTHEIELCLSVSDRIVLLSNGRLAIDSSVEGFRKSDAPEVQEFLGLRGDETLAGQFETVEGEE